MSDAAGMKTSELVERLSTYFAMKSIALVLDVDIVFTEEEFMDEIRGELDRRLPIPEEVS